MGNPSAKTSKAPSAVDIVIESCLCSHDLACMKDEEIPAQIMENEIFFCIYSATTNATIIINDILELHMIQARNRRIVARIANSIPDDMTWLARFEDDKTLCGVRTRLDASFFQWWRTPSVMAYGLASVTSTALSSPFDEEALSVSTQHATLFEINVPIRTDRLLPPFRGENRMRYIVVTGMILIGLVIA
jgi:hypothetical protein